MSEPGRTGAAPEVWAALSASANDVFDTLDTSITVWDGHERCLYVNAAAVRLLEQPASELVGRSLAEVMGEERYLTYAAQRAAVQAGRAAEFEWQVLRSQGWRTRRVRLLPRRRVGGALDGFIALADDVTEARSLRQAVADLAASEAKFRVLADSLPVGVFHSDAQSQNTYTNPRWQEMAGLTAEQSLGEGWRGIVHPDDRAALVEAWQRTADSGGEFEQALRIQRPDGTVRHVVARARPLHGADGAVTGFVGTNEDITEHLAAERELRKSQAFLDRIGRVANVGGWEVLLPQREVRWSDQTCRIHDRPPGHRPTLAEARGYYPGAAADTLMEAMRRAASEGTPFDLVLPLRTAAGRDIRVRVQGEAERRDGEVVRLIGALQDVTQRHEAELAIERSNEALRLLYEQTPAMLHSIDPQGRLLTVSDHWLATMGYRREEVIGRPSVDFLTPGSREALQVEYLPRLWQQGRSDRLALQMVRRDGSVMDVLLSAVVERDREDRPLRALAVIEDVTTLLDRAAQLRREQQARRELEQQAQELARLARERREMLDLLAHEVRQPLNNASAAIESAGAMLADKGEPGASRRLVRAQGVLSEVQRHVDNTLAMSTLLAEPPRPPEEEADIDTVISVALAELPRDERARVTVRRQTAARSALMDSALVRLALRNLLGNAIRHTAPATPVTVLISDSDAPLALFIDIVDEGGGLPEELLPRLFERGARVRHRDGRESHGLGLFIAHRALLAQGGDLRLLYTGQGGTALRLVLPQGQTG